MVFGEVIGVEAGLVREADELETVLQEPAHVGAGDALDVIEDSELNHG